MVSSSRMMRFTYFRSSENNEEPLYFWLLPFNPLSARFCICPKAKPPVIEVIRDSEAGREVHAGIESLSLWTLISCSLLFWFHPHIILRRISTRRYLWRLSKFYLAGSEAKRNLCRWTNKMVTFIQFLLDECVCADEQTKWWPSSNFYWMNVMIVVKIVVHSHHQRRKVWFFPRVQWIFVTIVVKIV